MHQYYAHTILLLRYHPKDFISSYGYIFKDGAFAIDAVHVFIKLCFSFEQYPACYLRIPVAFQSYRCAEDVNG